MKRFLFYLSLFLAAVTSSGAQTLQGRLEQLAGSFPGEVGIALTLPGGETAGVNLDKAYPLLSVMKFHQSLSVCLKLRNEGRNLMEKMTVAPEDLKPDTYSPMRELYPQGGTFCVFEIMQYALVESDNNASDLLFKIASPAQVTLIVRDLGIEGCQIAFSEDEMHQDISRCYENCSTPRSAARLLDSFYAMKDGDGFLEFLYDTMKSCQTGQSRIPRHIQDQVGDIAHKTGTGMPLENGKILAVNDIALINLKDGTHCALSVFVKDAATNMDATEALVAEIARTCVDELTK